MKKKREILKANDMSKKLNLVLECHKLGTNKFLYQKGEQNQLSSLCPQTDKLRVSTHGLEETPIARARLTYRSELSEEAPATLQPPSARRRTQSKPASLRTTANFFNDYVLSFFFFSFFFWSLQECLALAIYL